MKNHQVQVIEQFLAKLAPIDVQFTGSKNVPIHLINPHQIHLQILYLPYLSSQRLHNHDLHP